MKKITGIYRIKNLVNNKVYVGSSKSIIGRFYTHKNLLSKNKHFNKHLQFSYNKYGLKSFSFDILEVIEINDNNLINEREEFYIQLYKSNDKKFGYNCRIKCTTNAGRKLTDEHIKKLKISHLGKKQSKESIEKIRKSSYKPVYKINSNGEIISKYTSIIEASEKNNLHRQCISRCCCGNLNSTGGFYWCFVENYKKEKKYKKIKIQRKNIKYIYENVETGEKFNKLIDVSKILNINKSNLYHMFSGKLRNKTKFIRYEI